MTDTKMTTCLFFNNGEAREAAEFYASVFPNSYVDETSQPATESEEELVVEFTVCGRPFMGLNGGDMFKPTGAISHVVYTEDQDETDRYWNAIVSNGGKEKACGWCEDKWGFFWQITPRALIKCSTSPDRVAAKRAFDAMLTMKKIDIAAIEAAYRGESAL